MSNTPVTLVTKDASLDEFSVGDYRDMVIELRQTHSLSQLDDMTGNICSRALWAKVEHGEAHANRAQRNALRKLFNRPPLPVTVADATARASLDAAVWTVGDGVPETVVMVAGEEPITFHVNGSVTVVHECPVTPVKTRRAESAERPRYIRPCATETQDTARIELEASWGEVIDAGIMALREARVTR